VYVWNPTITKSTTTVPFLISSLDGNNPVTVDQTSNNGSWTLLASGVNFGQGTNGFVRVSNNSGSGGRTLRQMLCAGSFRKASRCWRRR
jgi:hypothetical protein